MINMMDYTQEITAYFDRLKVTIDKISKSDLSDLMNVLVDAKESGETDFHNGAMVVHPLRPPIMCVTLIKVFR